ncbi:hypothetical protein JCM11491_004869 [Sporobolomyces phaffii]
MASSTWASKTDPGGGGGDVGSGSHLPPAVLICATVSAALSTILSLVTVWLQLKHYHRPRLQRFVVRILVMVPIYSIASLVSLYSLDLAFFVDAVRDIYEAFVIYCFFSLLVEYLGGERSLIILLHGREPVKHPWPISLFAGPMDASDPFTFLGLKRGILQYVQIKPLLAFVTVVLKATGTYKDGSLQADSGYTYVSIAYNLSVSISLYALAMFWVATHDDLQPFRPMPKFLCVKGIIFFSFWQGFGVSILVAIGWLHSARYETEKLSLAVQDTLICFEMPLFAFMHLYAFSYTDYIDEAHIYSGRLPVMFALRDAFGYKDLVLDSLTTVRGTGFSYRTFEPASSTVHSFGPTLDRRLRAGLRYSTQNGKKYWLPQPTQGGTGGDEAYSRKGKEAWKSRPLHEARLQAGRKLVDERMGYAPISEEEERDTVHIDPKLLPPRRGGIEGRGGEQNGAGGHDEEGRNVAGWWEGAREYDEVDSDEDSEPESLQFGDVEGDDEMNEVYETARTLEFGDWSYPVVDASREHARRRLRDEEDSILSGKFKRAKGKEHDPKRPLARHRPGSYGALAETSPSSSTRLPSKQQQSASRRSAPVTSSGHPAPVGESIVAEVSTLVRSVLPGVSVDEDEDPTRAKRHLRSKLHLPKMGKKDDDSLPSDAVDLMVEDSEAEEEEMLRQRRRGEPTAKRTRVYRKAYVAPDERRGKEVREADDETVQARDVVERDEDKDGPRESKSADEVERFTVKEDEVFARQAGIDETPGVDTSGDLNPWERISRAPLRSFSCPSTSYPTSRAFDHNAMPPAPSPPAWREWRMNPPSSTPSTSTTMRNQPQIPRLPVPKLSDTLEQLVKSCAPLAASEQDLARLRSKVDEFAKPGGVGERLQQKLEARREQPETRNWLAEWWDTNAYMAYRDSVVINVSYYFGFNRLPQGPPAEANHPQADPSYVAASIAKTALEFRRLVATGVLEPELAGKTKEDGELCMESYKWAFNACRIPAAPSDYAVKVAENDREAQHFTIVKKNRFFSVPVCDDKGEEFSVDQLRAAIQKIVDEADKLDKAPAVGILTGINRDHWTEAQAHLLSDSSNHATLRSIHSSAFLIALDEATPTPHASNEGLVDFSERLWFGKGEAGNRWWDKPLQWTVFKNGEAGFAGEHSCMDGTPTARLNDYLTKRLLTNKPFPPPPSSTTSSPTPTPLPFTLDLTARDLIKAAEQEFEQHVAPYDVFYLSYDRYGKDEIKKMKCSPDGWVQMCFQLAYYLTHNKPAGTYEAAQTRRFQLGRTETVRILTTESLEFVKAMLDTAVPAAEKLAKFRRAVTGHGHDMKKASNGVGIDRHIFGLKMIASETLDAGDRDEVLGEQGLLGDALVKESSTWRMSTSQIYIRNSPSYGWGPVVAGGFGLPYMIHPESLQLTVTCEKSAPGQAYIENFKKACDMLMDLHRGAEGKL